MYCCFDRLQKHVEWDVTFLAVFWYQHDSWLNDAVDLIFGHHLVHPELAVLNSPGAFLVIHLLCTLEVY